MSSTNRGNQRHVSDYYVTPVYDIVKFLHELVTDIPDIFKYCKILDPCAGGDQYLDMSYPKALRSIGVDSHITTLDYRKDSRADIKEDYLTYEFNHKFDVVITNPPFYLALPIIKKALMDTVEGGYVIMLLRLNFFGSKARFPFWEFNLPKYVYVHHTRMSFTGGTTDSIEYMHAVWQAGYSFNFSKLRVI